MKQLIDPSSAERVLLFLAVAGPLVGLIFGAVLGAHTRRARCTVIAGVLLGGIGTLTYGMWRVYGIITNALGLDSVANLGLQLVLFAALGAILGAVILKVSLLLKRLAGPG
jgi:hypothetical protein